MCLESVLECALIAKAIIACKAICISSAMDACNTQHAEVLTNIGTDQTTSFLCLSARQLHPCHCSIMTGHAAWMKPPGGNRNRASTNTERAVRVSKTHFLPDAELPMGLLKKSLLPRETCPSLPLVTPGAFTASSSVSML